jgi:2-(1,2-epoxy-1,2-dihydrophenyl)acetyl-CoA isomerase
MDGAQAPAKIKTAIEDKVGIITLNDPGTLNAAGLELMAELQVAFEDFAYGDKVRAIVITGEGRGFCSGANLSGGGGGGTGGRAPAGKANSALVGTFNPFVAAVRKSPKPLVAAVNGVAAGVGVSIALSADLAVAADSAYFLLAFRRIGLVPDGGATWLLPRLIGKARAMELMLLGEKLPAKTAAEWGLINKCVPDAELMAASMQYARALADGPASLGLTRNLVWNALESSFVEQLEAEAYGQGAAQLTSDATEGVMAFVQKRPANFTGR